jgi:TRAP-type C4-dicarboxylate transport system permease large subunit/TRAP-type C4-dicarboxylate transport system permease small subunit
MSDRWRSAAIGPAVDGAKLPQRDVEQATSAVTDQTPATGIPARARGTEAEATGIPAGTRGTDAEAEATGIPAGTTSTDAEAQATRIPAGTTSTDAEAQATRIPAGATARGEFAVGRAGNFLERLTTVLALLIMAFNLGLTVYNIISRSFFDHDLIWSEDACVTGLEALALLGGAIAYRRNEYIRIRVARDRLSGEMQLALDQVLHTVVALMCGYLAYVSLNYCLQSGPMVSSQLDISEMWLNLSLPVGFGLIALFAIEKLYCRSVMRLSATALAIVLALVIILTKSEWIPNLTSVGEIVITFAIVVVFLLAGLPIAFCFVLSSLAYLYATSTPIATIPGDLADGLQSFLLLAIPFFLVAGFLLGRSGLSGYLTAAAQAVVGRLPGSVLHVVVIAMYFFSGISGSKVADMAAISTPVLRMSDAEGYDRNETVAVMATSASMGDTVPPSLGLIVLSSVTTLSTGALFLAGLIPAALTAVFIMALIAIRARRKRMAPAPRQGSVAGAMLRAVPVAGILALIVGGVVGGYSTPEESAALAVVYTFLLLGVERLLNTSRTRWVLGPTAERAAVVAGTKSPVIVRALRDATVTSGSILFLFAAATLFGRVVTILGLPQDISSGLLRVGGKVGFLILSMIALMVMGMVMEGVPAIIVFAPILLPIATQFNIDPIQFGILIVMAIGIGANSPPIGIGLYVAAQLGDTPVGTAGRAAVRYLIPLIVGVIVVAAWPDLTLVLPRALHFVQ